MGWCARDCRVAFGWVVAPGVFCFLFLGCLVLSLAGGGGGGAAHLEVVPVCTLGIVRVARVKEHPVQVRVTDE